MSASFRVAAGVLSVLLAGAAAPPGEGAGAAPTPQPAAAAEVTLGPGFHPDPNIVQTQAGGDRDAGELGPGCVGTMPSAPNAVLNYAGGTAPLHISAISREDSTIAVRAPDGTMHCDDDSAGDLNPVVTFETPAAGRYTVWVGTFQSGQRAEAQLHFSHLGYGHPPDPMTLPDRALAPAHGIAALAANFGERTVRVDAGGAITARALRNDECWGAISREPDYRVTLAAGQGAGPLVIEAQSEADTTLAIMGPDGQWRCNDDRAGGNANPSVSIANAPAGDYNIWVGTFAQGPVQPATLRVRQRRAR
ncbi:MAG: hypothetical protein AB7J28_04605 [Hyphomonadaceae bacterium]